MVGQALDLFGKAIGPHSFEHLHNPRMQHPTPFVQ
jgi:hypothetical protein